MTPQIHEETRAEFGNEPALPRESPPRRDRGLAEIFLIAALGGIRRDERARFRQALREACARPILARQAWRLRLSSSILVLLGLQIATGLFLTVHYSPVTGGAYASVHAIDEVVTLGWFVRQVHRWSARLLVLFLGIHLLRHFLAADYKAWGRIKWAAGVLLLGTILAFHATGNLLPFGADAQESTWMLSRAIGAAPLIGSWLGNFLSPEPRAEEFALTRSFVAHVVVLPWAMFFLTLIAFSTLSRRGDVAPLRLDGTEAARSPLPLWPDRGLQAAAFVSVVLGFLTTFVLLYPHDLGPPAGTQVGSLSLDPVFQVLAGPATVLDSLFGPGWAAPVASMSLTMLLFTGLLLLPWFDRRPERGMRWRKRIVVAGLLIFGLIVLFTTWGTFRS